MFSHRFSFNNDRRVQVRLTRRNRTFTSRFIPLLTITLSLGACSVSDLINTDFPPNSPNPSSANTPEGATDLYRGVIAQFRKATTGYATNQPSIVVAGAVIGDELKSGQYRKGIAEDNVLNIWTAMDSRNMPETGIPSEMEVGYDAPWRNLHGVRTTAMVALPLIRTYLPTRKDYAGHAFALWGMAEVFLANTFCSGIPLSRIDAGVPGGYTREAGSTTEQVYDHAVTLFDSALASTPDSAEVRNLARVGKGWALLNLKRYQDAAQAVRDVPTDFVYLNRYSQGGISQGVQSFAYAYGASGGGSPLMLGPGLVPDREGINGLPFRSVGLAGVDMRASVRSSGIRDPKYGDSLTYYPANWTVPTPQGQKSIVMASGVEARLIEAEAALAAGTGTWLTILNTLRTDGTFTVSGTDTTWGAGTGAAFFYRGVVVPTGSAIVEVPLPGLRPLIDPVTPAARLNLLFAERAYWLFLTGRRHSDLRRLVRQYGRTVDEVFPVGPYPAGPFTGYGSHVSLPAPQTERQNNPNFTGCLNRDA